MTTSGTNYIVPNQTLLPASEARTIVIGAGTGRSSENDDHRNFIGKIQNVKIRDATNKNLLTYFVPIQLNDTGEIGYWDEINNQFHPNAGAGEFLYP